MAIQRARVYCYDCHGIARVTPTESPWEYETDCESCGRRGLVSWAHASDPPRYLADEQTQRSIFDSEAKS